jgi:hypothetical protein
MEISPFIRRIGRRMTMAWAGSNRRESRICSGARSRSGGALAGLWHNKRLNLPPRHVRVRAFAYPEPLRSLDSPQAVGCFC